MIESSLRHAVVLAAGAGKRFKRSGGVGYKQLVPFRGEPVIARLVRQVEATRLFESVTVVLGPNEDCNTAIRHALVGRTVRYVTNADAERDNNLLSVGVGIKGLERPTLLIEADCVVSVGDIAAMVADLREDEIRWAEIGDLSGFSSGGLLELDPRTRGCISVDVLAEERFSAFKASGRIGKKIFGLTSFGSRALGTFRELSGKLSDPFNRYFHSVVTENAGRFTLTSHRIEAESFSFNTITEIPENMTWDAITLVDVSTLSAIEGHGPKRVAWLRKKIEREGLWTVPLKVERTKHLVMDGHHRFEVAKAMGLRKVPAELFTYDEVDVWTLRPTIEVSSKIILQNHENGVIFPYKTAKHGFPKRTLDFKGIPIDELR